MRTHPRRRVGGRSRRGGEELGAVFPSPTFGRVLPERIGLDSANRCFMAWKLFVDFVEVARLDQVPPGTGSVFTVADNTVAVFNVAGTICAIADACPHAGGSLGMGRLDGTIVTCAWHRHENRCHHRIFCRPSGIRSRLLSGEDRGRKDHGGAFLRDSMGQRP